MTIRAVLSEPGSVQDQIDELRGRLLRVSVDLADLGILVHQQILKNLDLEAPIDSQNSTT